MSIPDSLKLVNASEVSSVVVDRQNTTIYPTGGQSYPSGPAGGSVIEFKIPVAANKSVDMSTFFMHFNAQITNKATSNIAYFEDSIESVIDEVVVYVGNSGQEIERIGPGYNRLESAMNYYISDNFVKSVGSSIMACGLSRDERENLWSNGTNTDGNIVQCSVGLRLCGVANPNFIMSSQIFGQSNFLIVRVRLAPPAQCLLSFTRAVTTIATGAGDNQGNLGGGESTAGSAQYSLTNVRASFDMIQTSQDYQNQMSQFLASSSLVYPVKTWNVDFRRIAAGAQTFTENLTYNYRDTEAVFFWFNKGDELGEFDFAGEDRLHVPDNIQSLQLTINGQKVPSVPIDLSNGASEALCHTLVALGALHISEEVGPFSYEKILSVGFGTGSGKTTNSVNQPETTYAYMNLSGNRYYGRNITAFSNFKQLVGSNNVVADTAGLNPYKKDHTPSYFLIGINLRKLLDLPVGELSGLNLQNTSGAISYELKFGSGGNTVEYSMAVATLHNRFIELSGSGVSVNQ